MSNSRLPQGTPTEDTPTPQGGLEQPSGNSQSVATKSLPTVPSKHRYTDEQFLNMYFGHVLHHIYDKKPKWEPLDAWRDGFDEPLDPDYLAPFVYDLAARLGYQLVNNMWEPFEAHSPDTTAAGNDLPKYDPEADIKDTLRRTGEHKKQELERGK